MVRGGRVIRPVCMAFKDLHVSTFISWCNGAMVAHWFPVPEVAGSSPVYIAFVIFFLPITRPWVHNWENRENPRQGQSTQHRTALKLSLAQTRQAGNYLGIHATYPLNNRLVPPSDDR